MLYVVSRSIGQGRRAGMVAALGVGLYLAFLPQLVDPHTTHPIAQLVLLQALFLSGGLVFLLALGLAFGRIGDWLQARPGFWRVQRWIMGTTLGGLALWLALPERR